MQESQENGAGSLRVPDGLSVPGRPVPGRPKARERLPQGGKPTTAHGGVSRAKAAAACGCLWLGIVCAEQVATAADLICNGFRYSITNNEVTILGWQSPTNHAEIPAEIDGKPVTTIGAFAFKRCDLRTVSLPSSVTQIGEYAFSDCILLDRIEPSDTLTNTEGFAVSQSSRLGEIRLPISVRTIGEYAFDNCRGIRDVSIPDGVEAIAQFVFADCANLERITIPSSVKTIGSGVFKRCDKLTELVLANDHPAFRLVDGVLFNRDMTLLLQYLPSGRRNEYRVPDGVTTVREFAFYKVDSLTHVRIPATVTNIERYAFYDATNLLALVLPDSVVAIGEGAFGDCFSLTNVASLGRIGTLERSMFHSCRRLQHVVLPDTLTNIGSGAFAFCKALREIRIPGAVSTIGTYAFTECTALCEIALLDGVEEVGNGAFESCRSLQRVVIGESLKTIGADVFTQCTNLTAFVVADGNRSLRGVQGVLFSRDMATLLRYPAARKDLECRVPERTATLGANAFAFAGSLVRVILPATLTNIGHHAFRNCTALQHIAIPDGVSCIEEGTFMECYGLTGVTIGRGVTNIGDVAFESCRRLKRIAIPEGVVGIGRRAFRDCALLEEVALPDSVRFLGESVFANCVGLTYMASLGSVEDLGESAFINCFKLSCVHLPATLTRIRRGAFECTALQEISIPAGVRRIERAAFWACHNLKTVRFEGDAPELESSAFFGASVTAYHREGAKNWTHHAVDGNTTLGVASDGSFLFFVQNDQTVSISRYLGSNRTAKIPAALGGLPVTTIEATAFASNAGLTRATIPASVCRLAARAFASCTNLESVYFAGDPPSANADTFEDAPATIYRRSDAHGWTAQFAGRPTVACSYDGSFAAALDADGRMTLARYLGTDSMVVIPAEMGGKPVEAIGPKAFADCQELTAVTIPSSVRRIAKQAFEGCYRLAAVNGAAHVADVGSAAFDSCYSLTNAVVAGRLQGGAAAADLGVGPVTLRLHLTNGDILTGTNAMRSLSLQTSDAVLFLPLAHLAAIRPGMGNVANSIRLRNGDILKGKLSLQQIDLKGPVFAITISIRHVLEVEVMPADPTE